MADLDPYPFKSKLRNIFWPIHSHELRKFIPMSLLMFCVLFNQNVLRILKDSIVISEVSVEITSFAKVYCVTPVAAIFVIVYAKLINHLTFDRIFYWLIAVFAGFYTIFGFIIYPNIHLFHMDQDFLKFLVNSYPHLKWYIALIGNWSYVLFYTFSELWPNIFYVLLFWQFANEITTTNEARRFYLLFSFFGNSALIVVGLLMNNLSSDVSILHKLFTISNDKIMLTKISTILVIFFCMASCLLVRYITNNIMTDPTMYTRAKARVSSKSKLGIVESFKYIARSKYLWLMLICTASFGLSMNLIEAVWKDKIKELYPTVNEYAAFNSLYILWTGVAIIIMTIIGNNIMRLGSWFTAAVISPIIILSTGIVFFTLVVFDDQVMTFFDGAILISPLALAVLVGAMQNILSKGAKYSIWDTSRQMLYIPLDSELRTKGKAAVDVISPKIGKSSSSVIQSIIFTILPTATFNSIAPTLMVVFIIVCVFWIYAIKKIYLEYQKIV
ncbi:MAG: NTP/NDP exchange transporter [Rickettsiaceae bacterium]|nr:NTP/NDP exchange transporter [Rickettsiaceae bacterium]